jgi:hypothetical protein
MYTIPDTVAWNQYQQDHAANALSMYSLVPPGSVLDSSADHVLLLSGPASAQSVQPGRAAQATQADIQIGDLIYYTNDYLVKRLNSHLYSSPFGSITHVSDVSTLVQQLQISAPSQAAKLQALLYSFAQNGVFSACS